MEYIIAIPSYKRATLLKEKTLRLLKGFNIPKEHIEIFVVNEDMKKGYESIIGPYKIIVTGAKGICATRNFLRHYYKYNTTYDRVVYIDDDIENIIDYDKPIQNLHQFIKDAFLFTKSAKLSYWGLSPFHNKFYLKKEVSTTLKYISSCFCGLDLIEERKRHDILVDVDHGEDYQYSMEYFIRDGGVIRFNDIFADTKYFEEKGGICGYLGGLEPRKKEMEINCKYLVERYGSMCRLVEKEWGFDIRLNHRYKNNID